MTGMEAARVVSRIVPAIPIRIVTFDVTAQLLEEARSVGIKGAAPKSNTQELVNGVEALLRNETFFYERKAYSTDLSWCLVTPPSHSWSTVRFGPGEPRVVRSV